MNKQKVKAKVKKTGQYCVVAPAITLGTFGVATAVTIGKMTKLTGKALGAIAIDTVGNTRKYIQEVKLQPE